MCIFTVALKNVITVNYNVSVLECTHNSPRGLSQRKNINPAGLKTKIDALCSWQQNTTRSASYRRWNDYEHDNPYYDPCPYDFRTKFAALRN